MIIGGFQKFSAIDYPGKLSAIIFTRGCMFRCRFCHNPELVDPKQYSAPIDLDSILRFLQSRKGKLDGITITGGEPTLHRDLDKLIIQLKEMGYLIKLDTSGFMPEVIEDFLKRKLVDYIAMDIKAPLCNYPKVTRCGPSAERIGKSIGLLMRSGIDYEFRTTVAKILTPIEDVYKITDLICGAKKYAIQKFVPNKTLDPTLKHSQTYTEQEFNEIYANVKEKFVECVLR